MKTRKFSFTRKITDPRLCRLQAIFDDGSVCGLYMEFIIIPGETANLTVESGTFKLNGKNNFYGKWSNVDEATIMYLCATKYMSPTELYNIAGESVKNGSFGPMLKKMVEKEKAAEEEEANRQAAIEAGKLITDEGNKFVDFGAEYEGMVQKLSDYVGKGKYVLVDFWTSWCRPCRGEIPNIKKVWEKYKGDDFEVVGVATWNKPEITKKAIGELQIEYPQIMNAQNAGSDAYGISGIP